MTDALKIIIDDLNGPEIAALLQAHLELTRSLSPACSVHALDIDALRKPTITLWSGWLGGEILGCVAISLMDDTQGEIKSMHTAKAARGKGVAAKMLTHLETEAHAKGLTRLSLETGSQPAFAPARALYEKYGYDACPPFADYIEDPHSYFMTKLI